jgi:glycosyltransferase involved in cell wall biosynthesis
MLVLKDFMIMSEPFFSVVIPTYNRPIELKRAVNSIISQTFTDYEIIIVNNGDVPVENNYSSNKIIIAKEEKKGGNYARNTGINLAKGLYICFLDDDDEYIDIHLNTLYNLILSKNYELGLYKTLTKLENLSNNYIIQAFIPCPNQEARLEYAMKYLVFMASVCLPRAIAFKYQFDPLITIAQDYHLWLRILSDYPMFESPEATTICHYSITSVSRPNKEKYLEYIKVYKTLFKIKSIGDRISNRTKRDRIFRYYFWLYSEFKKELSFAEYLYVFFRMVYYKPKILFGIK